MCEIRPGVENVVLVIEMLSRLAKVSYRVKGREGKALGTISSERATRTSAP